MDDANRLQTAHVRRWHWGVLAFVSAFGIVYGSLLPFTFQTLTFAEAWGRFRELLVAGPAVYFSRQDVAVNVLIAVPLAFSLMGAVLLDSRRMSALLSGTILVLVVCLAISIGVEFAQLWVERRVTSVRDIAAQFTGEVIGCVLWLAMGPALCRRLEEFFESRERWTRIVWLLNAYVLGLVIWSLLPFDVATNLNHIIRKYPRGQIELIPFTFVYRTSSEFWYAMVTDAAIFIPVGVWSVFAWLRRESRQRSVWSATVICLGVNVGIETLQLLILSRYTSTRDVLLGMVGCFAGMAGVWLWRRNRGQNELGRSTFLESAGFWMLAFLICSIAMMALNWIPYQITRDPAVIRQRLQSFLDLPFRRLQAGQSDGNALFHIMRNFAWYIPLGGLVAVAVFRSAAKSQIRPTGLVIGGLAITTAAFAGELGRILFSDRAADLTEALVHSAGGIAGMLVTAMVIARWSPRRNRDG